MAGGAGDSSSPAGQGILGVLLNLLVAEKTGFDLNGSGSVPSEGSLKELADSLARQAMSALQESVEPTASCPAATKPVEPFDITQERRLPETNGV
jgi:hypothetical protein